MSEQERDPCEANADEAVPVRSVLEYHTPRGDDASWVRLWTAQNSFEANLAVARLQVQGLHARVDMENTGGLGAWGGTGPGGVNLQVIRADVPAAREVIAQIVREQARRRHARSVACPGCAASPAKRILHPVRWMALAMVVAAPLLVVAAELLEVRGEELPFVLVVLGVVLLVWPLRPRWCCAACGRRWVQAEPEEVDDDHDDSDRGGEERESG